jgi:CBS domain containing-hemolysin-like protein
VAVVVLLGFSAFFSGSETALFSIHKVRLRGMKEEPGISGRLVARMMDHPARLLTTILVGNMIVNTLTSVLLGTRIENLFQGYFGLSAGSAYLMAVGVCTGILVLFGEITPKVFAVRTSEMFARFTVLPLIGVEVLLRPLQALLLRLTGFLFRITRFHEIQVAPFITDEEFKSVLSEGEAHGVIEEEERQMIQGILEFTDARVREILVPRPDVVAVPEDATVAEALSVFREHEFSRMPVYSEDLDDITGILVAKDLLPSFAQGELSRPVKTLVRPPYFVPETMTVQQFVKDAQRHRTHLAAVVDEYGGTAGIVTLQDAIEEVVGDILDEDEQEAPAYELLSPGEYRLKGSLTLDKLSELVGVSIEDEEHTTVAGFLMYQTHKIPEVGDQLQYSGLLFTVEACDGKRASAVRIRVLPKEEEGSAP